MNYKLAITFSILMLGLIFTSPASARDRTSPEPAINIGQLPESVESDRSSEPGRKNGPKSDQQKSSVTTQDYWTGKVSTQNSGTKMIYNGKSNSSKDTIGTKVFK